MEEERFSFDHHLILCSTAQSAFVWKSFRPTPFATKITNREIKSAIDHIGKCEPPVRLFQSREFDKKSAKFIGEGTFSNVYKIYHKRLCETVVLKRMKGNVPVKYVMDEGNTLRTVQHKRVVKLFGWFYEGYPFVVLQTCLGALYDYTTHMTERDKHRAYIQVLEGTAFIHSKDIIHCDLKLENILVTTDFNFKISDFGDAVSLKGFDFFTRTRRAGTSCYQSLEILQDKKYSKRSDLWALGCTIWCAEMQNRVLVRCLNVPEETPKNLARCIIEGVPTKHGPLEPLHQRISRCVYKDPILELMFDTTMTAERFAQNQFILTQNKRLNVETGNLETSFDELAVSAVMKGRKSGTPSVVFRALALGNPMFLMLSRFYYEDWELANFHANDTINCEVGYGSDEPEESPEIIEID